MTTAQIKTLAIGAPFNFSIPGAKPKPLTVSDQTIGDKFIGVDDLGVTYTWMLTGLLEIPEIQPVP
jgi:hypothetical protein